MKKGLCILGATGSIGISTLDVVARHPEHYRVVALTAQHNIDLLYQQCLQFYPDYAVVVDKDKALILQQRFADIGCKTQVLAGAEALAQVASLPEIDTVMAAIVGAAGLLPTLSAAKAGKTILLANKEALVMSGDIFMHAVSESGALLLPIDSEHNAIFQCMPSGYSSGQRSPEVRRILLTASGGPFRQTPLDQLVTVTPEQAVAHPKWEMGRKISVDSATMMNKGLEVIEACLLFSLPTEMIQVVIHPQSIIHSMVDYTDGSVLAQMGNPDMRTPIAYALAYPQRFESGVTPLDIFAVKQMDFEPPNLDRFPCLRLAYQAVKAGGIMPTVLNAANEIAVEAYLQRRIRFTDIARIIETSLTQFSAQAADSLEVVLQINQQARIAAEQLIVSL
ncbi:MAG: hypothetical protein RL637_1571 [Pseudomonadota bacterium]